MTRREQAMALRKQGKSYREITATTGIPKSTLHEWFHLLRWSQRIKKALLVENRRAGVEALKRYRKAENLRIEQEKEVARNAAKRQYKELMKNPLFVAGIMLYWGEGDKSRKHGQVRMSNSDVDLLRVFIGFLRSVCNVPEEQIKAWVLLYPDLDSATCLTFWQENLNMSFSQFIKPTVIQGRHAERRLVNGVCTVYTGNSILKTKILEWIKLSAGIV